MEEEKVGDDADELLSEEMDFVEDGQENMYQLELHKFLDAEHIAYDNKSVSKDYYEAQ